MCTETALLALSRRKQGFEPLGRANEINGFGVFIAPACRLYGKFTENLLAN
jgi:hypothetical protein